MHVGLVTRSQVDYALDLAYNLNSEGINVTLYLDQTHLEQEAGDSIQPMDLLHKVGLLPPKCKVHLLKPPRMRDPSSFVFFLRLKNFIKSDGVELVHVLLNPGEIWFAFLAYILSDIPVTTTLIVPIANAGEHLPEFIIKATNRIALSGSDMVIVNGSTQVELVKRLYEFPPDHIAYVPLSLYTRAVKWRRENVTEEPGTVLFFGRAVEHKGLEYLIKAQPFITKKVPHARFLISAHGESLERCRRMIDDPGKFEIVEGVVSGDVMATFFQRSSLVALPYITASTSGVLVTAFSFGKPVVASRVGCLAEYVEDGERGLLVTPTNIEELAEAIIRLLLDDDLRHRMGANTENWSKKSEKETIKQTIDVYRRALKNYQKKDNFSCIWFLRN
jgi:glycosyltransferase involved in cell wall biosynthesis